MAGGLYKVVQGLEENLARLREAKRDLLPTHVRVRGLEQKAEGLHRKIDANKVKLEASLAREKEVNEQLLQCQASSAELRGFFTAGQEQALEETNDELEQKQGKLEEEQAADAAREAAAAPAAAAPPTDVGSLDADSIALRAALEPGFLRDILAKVSGYPAGQRAMFDIASRKQALVEDEAKARAAAAQAEAAVAAGPPKNAEDMDLSGPAPDGSPPAVGPAAAAAGCSDGSLRREPVPAAAFTPQQAAAALAGSPAERARSGSRTPRARSPGGRAPGKSGRRGGKET